MYVGKIRWYESFWLVLICFIISPATGFLSLFPAIIFCIFRVRKEIKRIIINKKNNLPLNHKIPYEEPKMTDTKSKLADPIELRINELIKENPTLSEDEIKDLILKEEKERMVTEMMGNFKIEVNRGSKDEFTPSKKYTPDPEVNLDYTKVRKLTTDFVVFDFETTGLSHFNDEIIQVAAVRYINFEEVDKFVTFVKPSEPIPSRITEITGITNDDVKNAPSINTVLPSLIEFVDKDVLVAHNAPFDMKFLLCNIHKENLEYRKFKVIDTLTLARKFIDSTKNHKLPTLKSFLRLNHLNSHEALHDCYVAAELYKYCYEESFVSK